jgi:hypothetical protein
LRGEVSIVCTEDVDRAAGPEEKERPLEKKVARPLGEEGYEDEDSE